MAKDKALKTQYEMVIGLEVHAELDTSTKIFCGCSTKFGAAPNTQTCPVCMGFPGTLPVLNEKVAELAVKAGLATNCSIAAYSKQDRKNYFYPDLTKAYQISQYDLPLCERGHIDIQIEDEMKRIGITRIHIEEDAGKLIHTDGGTMIDYNRAGIPLIEIVSEPDIRSAQEAVAYLKKLRAIIIYAGLSDAKMNEGSFRCDVNLSVREKGSDVLGTRTEMKNLNSFSFIAKAIESEFKRQTELVEQGESIVQETRRWDEKSGKSVSMRTKEDAHDYRYFPDPDLPPLKMSDSFIESVKSSLPVLPDERKTRYIKDYSLTAYQAEQIVSDKYTADYFESAISKYENPSLIATLIMSDIFRLMSKTESETIPFEASELATVAKRIDEDVISHTIAKKLIEKMWQTKDSADDIIEKDDMRQITDRSYLTELCKEALLKDPSAAASYRAGKEKALQAIIGDIMRSTSGKASPTATSEILRDMILNTDIS